MEKIIPDLTLLFNEKTLSLQSTMVFCNAQ